MKHFNLSDWGLRHQALVLYLMVVLTVVGAFAYTKLGQSEDPPFTFKVMVVRANWPGASAQEVEQQVTDKLEKKIQELGATEFMRSYSKPGESLIFLIFKDSTSSTKLPDLFYQVRKRIGDIRYTLPAGVQGPYFNDEFGDTFGNIFALVGEGLSYADLKRYGDSIRGELLKVPDVSKVEFFGEQEQRVYIELSNLKLATLGLDIRTVMDAIVGQNAKAAAGFYELEDERIFLRPGGQFENLDTIRELPIRAGGRSFRLGDVAEVKRSYVEPPRDKMRFMGHEAFGIGVSMRAGGDIIELGRRLDEAVRKIDAQLPAGVRLERVADQPNAVSRGVQEFVRSLTEAVLIVLAVSLISLGLRTGIVVAISIPVVLAITFVAMHQFGIGLHKISLGALIIALGLLVDDAIIAVEMMATKMEQGWDRAKAASFAYTSTAMPMLSGTLVTAAGFLPIATAQSSTGEYTRSIFQVTVIALLVSWVAAVLFVPYIGYHLLPDVHASHDKPNLLQRWLARFAPQLAARLRERAAQRHGVHGEDAIYHSGFYRRFRSTVEWCVRFRWITIGGTLATFVVSIWGFQFVPQQFFPSSTRPELLIDLRLAQGASFHATENAVKRLEAVLEKEPGIENYVAYVGTGSPRFYLPLDQQLPQANFAQFVVLTKGTVEREALRAKMIKLFERDFSELSATINRLENGPPVGFPVQYRVSGPDHAVSHRIADELVKVVARNPHLSNVQKDWNEASKVVKVHVDAEKARLLGVSVQDVANFLNTSVNGQNITEFREGIETIQVTLRGAPEERRHLSLLSELTLPTGSGRGVPLTQIATLEYAFEPGVIWRRDRVPTVSVRATLYGSTQPATVTAQLAPEIAKMQAKLPLGYHIDIGGAVEESAKGGASVAAGMPLFLIVVLTVLMIQLQSFSRVAMVVLTAPLGMIGVTLFLLLFNQPFGFVAMLGTIALSGMIMRNSVILVDQIRQDLQGGRTPWEAVIESTVRRFRPIMLTAAAAILAMIPLTRSAFFGPMAVAIMGGLTVATVLTLLFLPALYAAWYRIRPPA
ncbi:efflux RND transporter permease subunit [Niveibacterium sp. 24ML]|uniref:efflux RND transporter permease subunit n=1 Tax=Niveibacterium sp. 24ML TaxID=2985512 RepID=UPI002271FA3D|nr:efflux RND transporter permease subunit [Niveibacterium sp. 24ML]MCX9154541.1 efflux RND transporter permease subunit [Niveibacterium sp. 24ML]